MFLTHRRRILHWTGAVAQRAYREHTGEEHDPTDANCVDMLTTLALARSIRLGGTSVLKVVLSDHGRAKEAAHSPPGPPGEGAWRIAGARGLKAIWRILYVSD